MLHYTLRVQLAFPLLSLVGLAAKPNSAFALVSFASFSTVSSSCLDCFSKKAEPVKGEPPLLGAKRQEVCAPAGGGEEALTGWVFSLGF